MALEALRLYWTQFHGTMDVTVCGAFNESLRPGRGSDHPFARALEQVDSIVDRFHFSGETDDATFLRRVSLDLTGTLPSPDEAQRFAADQSKEKRARLVDDLLKRPEFVDYWTLQFSDLLQNRKERDHDVRGTKGVRSFHTWLRNQVAANRPWDQLARDIITSSGDVVNSPQIGYYITLVGEKQHADESEIGDSIAQSFLGSRIGCAKCHNHPLEKYSQDDYYHFAAFFSKVSIIEGGQAEPPIITLRRVESLRLLVSMWVSNICHTVGTAAVMVTCSFSSNS